jgi:class 3 adenylate cyclase/DNA-binding winged helix-turn-helix (wHTH) protein/tetratricopeptide (TPR) repeat protein
MRAEMFRFEDFELDPTQYRLRRNGVAVHLEGIPFQLLCLLVERRGQLVTGEEIRERIWGKGVFIDSENSINTAVRKLRRALNDDAQRPRFIITVPARGYRFDAVPRPASDEQAALIGLCANCGAKSPSTSNFCSKCGTPVDVALPICAEAEPRGGGPMGERRHLTVLFCDLVGSTEIAARLDPEEWRETVASYQQAATEAITRFGGFVAKYLSDGLMAFFGYPEAHDNDAERAARAGLAMLDAIAKLNEQAPPPLPSPMSNNGGGDRRLKLAARVGIDSGAVVVGAGAGKDADVFGDTPIIAARVQAAAGPGAILITEAVHKLISGLFMVEDRGAQALSGIERLVHLYRVTRTSGVRGRLQAAAAARALTPFVGREDELRSLMTRWERGLEGEGQVVLIIGEAGIGKSRLVQQFHEQITAIPHTSVEAAAAPFFQNTPFYSICELLRQLAALQAEQSAEDQLEQLESALELAGLNLAEHIPLIAPLLNLPMPAKYSPLLLPPEQQRRRMLAALVEWVLGTARAQPLVITLEDLHWADPSTLELTQLLIEQGVRTRLLLLYTARPEFRPQWPLRSHHTQMMLSHLSTRNVREMIAQVAARNTLSSEAVDAVIERTGGVPLFVEELTRAVLESGSAMLIGHQIPVTLHDSLMARLDGLGAAKEVIQAGAVIGSEFSYELLHAVHPLGAEELQSALRSATDAELVYVRGIAPEATYRFKHALIRDAAYEALLKSRCKELHGQVARTIDEKFPSLNEAHPEVIARHWTEAGETAQAITEWTRAGKVAESHNAFTEAHQSYEQALVLLSLLPESAERDLQELNLRQSIIWLLRITRVSSPASVDARARAIALAKKSGNLSQLISLMHATAYAAFNAGDLETAAPIADEALELAEREGNPTNLGLVYYLQVSVRSLRGDLAGTEEHFARGLKFFEDATIWPLPLIRLTPLAVASANAWSLGRADLARERLARMMAEANQNNPAEVALSGVLGIPVYLALGEYERAEMLAARVLELSEKHQMPQFAEIARSGLGWARARLGRPSEGVALIRQGIAGMAAIGTHIDGYTVALAESQALSGAIDDALETIKQVLQHANGAQPEAFRLRGELQTKQERREAAEADFRTALKLARSMGSKAYELRATMSLARLLRDTCRRDEARTMLANIYNWFTEGFDTPDLKDARILLDDLAK